MSGSNQNRISGSSVLSHSRSFFSNNSDVKQDPHTNEQNDSQKQSDSNESVQSTASEKESTEETVKESVQNDGPSAEEIITSLEAKITTMEKEVKEAKERQMRALAEMENVRKIANRDVSNANAFGISKFAKSMLDVADNLQRALDAVPLEEGNEVENPKLVSLHTGVAATERELQRALTAFGVKQFGSVGDVFDPNVHNAMYEAPSSEYPNEQRIIAIIKTGYMINERVLRAADVGVSKPDLPGSVD
eukprot:CAMPEP_0182441954 /NCGR_PEP_ID=MMETSP1172-20130603/934_1 /TAXON_ID=708627 /ORGANISM="Timspurckia oligopyrenoides, Strain CCMP3278" /LENGTH=247 /DNA_ID=CAMNT_0024636569 /DNA_START=125 /DNA_END=868 /DNA_ORIENTATION=+